MLTSVLGYSLLTMGTKLDRLMVRALEEACATLGDLAEEAGYHPVSFARYKTGDRRVSPGAAVALAKVLRRRSADLAALGDRLEETARAEKKGG